MDYNDVRPRRFYSALSRVEHPPGQPGATLPARRGERAGTSPMSDFAVRIEDGYATAVHHKSGHVFEFSIAAAAPYLRGGTVRENQKADRTADSLWGAAG